MKATEEPKVDTGQPKKQRRGFAVMDRARLLEICSKGGVASHKKGTGHEWNRETAKAAAARAAEVIIAKRAERRAAEELKQPWLPTAKKESK